MSRTCGRLTLARWLQFPWPAMDDDTKEYPVDVILLDSPIYDADALIEAELDNLEVGDDTEQTSEVVLLDMVRLDSGDLDFA